MLKKPLSLILFFCISGGCLLSSTVNAGVPATAREFFPPSNVTTGGGFLFFPAGGTSSLYAAPVFADERVVTALQDIKGSMEALNVTIESFKTSVENSKDNIDCSSSDNLTSCVNKVNGVICVRYLQDPTNDARADSSKSMGHWYCSTGTGWLF